VPERPLTFKVDENLPEDVVALLRAAGHDAATVADQGLAGHPDDRIAEVIQREARTFVTLDVGFGDIRRYPPGSYAGLVVLRLARQDKPHVLQVIARLLPVLAVEPVLGRLWVVDEQAIRIRSGDADDSRV
jgi:predicted nuclease of predicted toxin-antitoxin system